MLSDLIGLGWPWGALIALASLILWLVHILLDPDKTDLWRGRIFRAAYGLTGNRDYEKKYISNDIQGRLNLARREIHFGPAILASAVDVEWVDGVSPDSYAIGDDEFIVRLDPAESQDRNIVFLAAEMVKQTSLVGARRVIQPELQRALDFTTTKKLLESADHQRSLDTFYNDYLRPAVSSDSDLRAWTESVTEIDERGLYATLLLIELEEFARSIQGLKPRPHMVGEVEQLVQFVHDVATKGVGERVPLEFIKGHIAVGVTLVAKSETALQKGADPYLQAVEINIERGADALYVIIWRRPDLKSLGPGKWRRYKSATDDLVVRTKELPRTEWHFSAPYSYVDLQGRRREGVIHRFRVDQTA